MLGLIVAEVRCRAISSTWVPADLPSPGSISAYLMAAAFTFGAAMTLRAGGQIRVNVLLRERARRVARRASSRLSAPSALPSAAYLDLGAGLTMAWFCLARTALAREERDLCAASWQFPLGPRVTLFTLQAVLARLVRPAARRAAATTSSLRVGQDIE